MGLEKLSSRPTLIKYPLKVIFLTELCTAKESLSTKMIRYMKENTLTIKEKAKESSSSLKEIIMTAIGLLVNKVVLELCLVKLDNS